MASILTNGSTMGALSTLRGVDRNLAAVSAEVSTGKAVATAEDNAAIWSVASVMRADAIAFRAISASLSLGEATVAVARGATEALVGTLDEMRARIVAAQAPNVDLGKLDADVQALKEQARAIIDSAQFNGLNLLIAGDPDPVTVLASLNRAPEGVTASMIEIPRTPLRETAAAPPAPIPGAVVSGGNGAIGNSTTTTVGGNEAFVFNAALLAVGDEISVAINATTVIHVVGPDDLDGAGAVDAERLGDTLLAAINPQPFATSSPFNPATPGFARFSYDGAPAGTTVSFTFSRPEPQGGFADLWTLSVATTAEARVALADIDPLIETAVSAAALYGSKQRRLDAQGEVVRRLTDALIAGVGGVHDADLEASSARLQALQVQRDLGVQALSIANAAAQNLLALFR